MARRSEQRRAAAFALYQADVTGRPLEDTMPRDASLFTRSLAYAAEDRQEELDDLIARHARGWSLGRRPPREKALLRPALVEILPPDAVPADTPIPAEGAIEEAVQTAKTYAAAEAGAFVNGIPAAVLRETRQNQPQ